MFRDNGGCKEVDQEADAEVVAWIIREVVVEVRAMAVGYMSLEFKGGPEWRHKL